MKTRMPLRAIIADDHPIVVKGIKSYLERDGAVEVVATAHDTQELAEALDSTACDFVFSDIGMQGMEGESSSITFLRRFSSRVERPRLVVITMLSQARMLAGLLRMGVDGVVDKRDGLESLETAIAAISAGRRFASPLAIDALSSLPETMPACVGVLSRREWEVFRLYASGMVVHEIASRFGRSSKTIATQKRSGMRKLGLSSEADLVEYFRQVGLV
ncbi:response regulator transcription factor [Caballeronia sp. LP006]|uniref:response regulator transcription factor n=1 Tax=unclassified Caballeronia TaxID=2646786 RepID=UPI002029124A|nr:MULTISPECIES: response regulator transcription factor [unclassified Caballeronia]MDR5830195.1 response regulator transcription factor [Caballeronia sp. LP006]